MSALLYLAAAAVCLYVIVYYGVFRGASCPGSVSLKGKTAIVTGNDTCSSCLTCSFIHTVLVHLPVNTVLKHFPRCCSGSELYLTTSSQCYKLVHRLKSTHVASCRTTDCRTQLGGRAAAVRLMAARWCLKEKLANNLFKYKVTQTLS